jgi:chemotaxis regulatin CheY-phosphate phosphatase CheZ
MGITAQDTRPLPPELIQDSEAALRLVDALVAELARSEDDDDDEINGRIMALLDYLGERRTEAIGVEVLLVRMYAELQRILYNVRRSRGLLEEAAIQHLETTSAKLHEVSSTTEFAATNMLDGVDRSLALVDHVQLNPKDDDAFANLRDELHALITALQFQDIISQQLDHASTIIAEMESQLRSVTRMFAVSMVAGTDPVEHAPLISGALTFDPAASVSGAANRQALADDIFATG